MALKKIIAIVISLILNIFSIAGTVIEKTYSSLDDGPFIRFFTKGTCTISFSEHSAHTGSTSILFSGTYEESNNTVYLIDSNKSFIIVMHLQGDTLIMEKGIDGMIGKRFAYIGYAYNIYPKVKLRNPIDTIQSAHIYRKEIPNGIFSMTEPKYIDYIKHDYWIEFSNNSYSLYWKNILFFSGTVSYDDECNILQYE